MSTLAQELEDALIEGYHQAGRETGYWGRRFLQAVRRNGGLATVKRMLAPRTTPQRQGLDALLSAGRPDLTVEFMILQPRFRSLFTAAELQTAEERLQQKKTTAAALRERLYPDELEPGETYVEGASRRVTVNAYERDRRARLACLKHHGTACTICAMTFESVYGDVGKDFIHVHHLKPIARTGTKRRVDPEKDLIPVCPNCHAMLHRQEPPLTPKELRQRLMRTAG